MPLYDGVSGRVMSAGAHVCIYVVAGLCLGFWFYWAWDGIFEFMANKGGATLPLDSEYVMATNTLANLTFGTLKSVQLSQEDQGEKRKANEIEHKSKH